ncbi:WD repeat-containing protein 82 [Porphyridium purpureum]|uniref:WD repeat-containing protein 82 n=1 Tax=Porphyridium purpureum TaxID=35688 RepID=A0A5J4YM97_PORPP|nr:WD repeat-containing protein 82 [Porphyridium purpureum]|eukprot:POR9482..scf295_9
MGPNGPLENTWTVGSVASLKLASVQRAHNDDVVALAVSSDGTRAASVDATGRLDVTDLQTGVSQSSGGSSADRAFMQWAATLGASAICFTHDRQYVLAGGRDGVTRLLHVERGATSREWENSAARAALQRTSYFLRDEIGGPGHGITQLSMGTRDDSFLACDAGGVLGIFDLRTPGRAQMQMDGECSRVEAAFTPEGSVLGVLRGTDANDVYRRMYGTGTVNELLVYDIRRADLAQAGPVSTVAIDAHDASNLRFSASGVLMLLLHDYADPLAQPSELVVYDALDFAVLSRIPISSNHGMNAHNQHTGAAPTRFTCAEFSPECRFAAAGSSNGMLQMFEIEDALQSQTQPRLILSAKKHPLPIRALKFSPWYPVLVTACQNIGIWTPDPSHKPTPQSSNGIFAQVEPEYKSNNLYAGLDGFA